MNNNRFFPSTAAIASANDLSLLLGKTVLIDKTCFCRFRGMSALGDELIPFLAQNQMTVCLAKSALTEINREIEAPDTDPAYRRSLQSGLKIIQIFSEAGLIKLIGADDESSEEIILKYIMLNRTRRELIVFTQQKRLADDIALLNGIRTSAAPQVLVRRINNDGGIECFQDAPQIPQSTAGSRTGSGIPAGNAPVDNALKLLGML